MDALKKFIQKKKADSNFKKAGPGHRLTDPAPSSSGGKKPSATPTTRKPSGGQTSEEKRLAAAAAVARQEKTKPATSEALMASRQIAYIRGK